MALKVLLENLDGLDGLIAALYVERDGKFVLDLDGVDDHPAVANLKSAHERVKMDRDKIRKDLKGVKSELQILPNDFDPDAYQDYLAHKDDDPEIKNTEAEVKKRVETRLARELSRENDRHLQEVASLSADRERYQTALMTEKVHGGLTNELLGVNVRGDLLDGARAKIGQNAKMLETEDGFHVVVADPDLGEIPMAEYVKNWARSSQGKSYIKAQDNDGGGAGGGKLSAGNVDLSKMTAKEKLAFANRQPA